MHFALKPTFCPTTYYRYHSKKYIYLYIIIINGFTHTGEEQLGKQILFQVFRLFPSFCMINIHMCISLNIFVSGGYISRIKMLSQRECHIQWLLWIDSQSAFQKNCIILHSNCMECLSSLPHSCLYKLANLMGNNGSSFVFSSLSVAKTEHFP